MFSPEKKPTFIVRVRESLQRDNTTTSMIYSGSALLADGALQLASSLYQTIGALNFMSYHHDILLPIQCYFTLRASLLNTLHKDKFNWVGSLGAAATVFGAASIAELLQKVELFPGTYDFPGDFIAYGTGVGLAVTLDAITFRKIKTASTNKPLS